MSEEHESFTNKELQWMCDNAIKQVTRGLLEWMDMAEGIKEDKEHDESCDGDCSPENGYVDQMFDINTRHIDRVLESFRQTMTEIEAVKEKLASDAREDSA